jgi:hypothetical protein
MMSGTRAIPSVLRHSAAPYLSVLAVVLVLGRFIGYLSPQAVLLKGQSPSIVLIFAAFGLSAVLWFLVKDRPRARGPFAWFLIAMSVAWVAHLLVSLLHGDLFNHTAWLYVPILLMIFFKPPKVTEGWVALQALGWATALALVVTRLLEILGAIPIMYVPQWIIDLEKGIYWLPLSGYLGLDGRWPGPFGHNGTTAMMGALLVVLAFARWSKSSWVFLVVGVLTLLLTGGRASVGASVLGIAVVAIFATRGPLSKVPLWLRIIGGCVFVVVAAFAMLSGDAGSSGRQGFWPAFLELWQTSIWVGVGGTGIAVSGGITQEYEHAHNMYIDELARYGIFGFVTQFLALGIGIFILFKAALRGLAGPLALVAAFAVTALTEPRNDWVHPSVTGFMLILAVAVAGAQLVTPEDSGGQDKVHEEGALPSGDTLSR